MKMHIQPRQVTMFNLCQGQMKNDHLVQKSRRGKCTQETSRPNLANTHTSNQKFLELEGSGFEADITIMYYIYLFQHKDIMYEIHCCKMTVDLLHLVQPLHLHPGSRKKMLNHMKNHSNLYILDFKKEGRSA